METLRTPGERFAGLPDYPFPESHQAVEADGAEVRMHYVDVGPRDGPAVLLLHGEPTWSYLYRKMIPPLAAGGCRVIAPDLIGFGKSDKPARQEDHTYSRHVGWVSSLLDRLGLRGVTLFGQDWGGLIGLRVLAGGPDRFARVVASNTGLPDGTARMPSAWYQFREFSQTVDEFPCGLLVGGGCAERPPDAVLAAYDAPFPDETYKAAPRRFPAMIPIDHDDAEAVANREAWGKLASWERPFLCAFSDGDPMTRGADRRFRETVPGARRVNHVTIEGAGHFVQEDRGEQLAAVVLELIATT